MAPSVYRDRQYLRQKWRLNTGQFTVSLLFMRVIILGFLTHTNKIYITWKPLMSSMSWHLGFSIWLISLSEMASEIDASLPFCGCLLRVFNTQKRNLDIMKALDKWHVMVFSVCFISSISLSEMAFEIGSFFDLLSVDDVQGPECSLYKNDYYCHIKL